METIPIELLSIFAAVAGAASFSEAALRLGTSKSSVSRAIAGVEGVVGARLFNRTTRRVALTTAGRELFARVQPLLSALRRSVHDFQPIDQPSGRLRVTATTDLGTTILPELVVRFAARYPAVEIELELSNSVVDLVADELDAALRISRRPIPNSASLTAKRLSRLALQIFAAPSYLATRATPRTPDELATHEWVVFGDGAPVRLENNRDSCLVRPRGRVIGNDMGFMRAAVRAGAGLGFLPTFLGEEDVLAGRLVRVLPKWAMLRSQLWLITAGGRRGSRKVTAFSDFLRENITERQLFLAG